jgi:murein DD-endopeptidase MepM/ murein hydrolase activator NlpD
MQNTGIQVYVKSTGNTRNDVDAVITATFATEDNFLLSPSDYSLFAFFDKYVDYVQSTKRLWMTPTDSSGNATVNLKEEGIQGSGTPNTYTETEVWDFPVLKQLTKSPTGSKTITIIEHFGDEPDRLNGGYKNNFGLTLKLNRGSYVRSMTSGMVTAVGYNLIYGNYVEITDDNVDIMISTVTGQRYQITGIKYIYGYLLGTEYGGINISKNQSVSAGDAIGKVGVSGATTGDQVYVAMYVQCNILDENDNVAGTIGYTPVDLEPYFTTRFASGDYNVYDEQDNELK